MKKGLFLILAVLGMRSAVAADSCPKNQTWQCVAAQPPALGVFCGCADPVFAKSIGITVSPKGNQPWNSCLTCQ